MKACEQKNCLHYDLDEVNHCDSKKTFDFCDAKIYKGNRIITQMDMNEIIDSIAADYPVEIFPSPTSEETNKLPYDVRRYISSLYLFHFCGRLSANMARVICKRVKKELEKYFKEINDKELKQ